MRDVPGRFTESLRRLDFQCLQPGRLLFDEPMALHTTFRVGGSADAVFFPDTATDIATAIQMCREACIPVTILGNGSNVVVSDAGIRGLVIVFGQPFSRVAIQESGGGHFEVTAEAGATLAGVAYQCAAAGLAGMEFACGIPGTIGGAVFMNAGAYDGCMADTVSATTVLDDGLLMREVDAPGHRFGYRESALMTGGYVILSTRLSLRPGDRAKIEARIEDLAARRRQSQPLELPSAGSAFKRPPGHFAGGLISDCGLKGVRIGQAQVSEKHAGFIVNIGGATAADVRGLADLIMRTVMDRTGVALEPEIRFIGDWDGSEALSGSK